MNLKVFLVLLVLLVILFVVGAGAGFLAGNGQASLENLRPAWLRDIGTLIPSGTATFNDVQDSNDDATCIDRSLRRSPRLTVPPGQRCWYSLTNAARPRSLKVSLVAGTLARVELYYQPANKSGSIGERKTLSGGQAEKFDIFPRQSKTEYVQLRVFCQDLLAGCVLQIQE